MQGASSRSGWARSFCVAVGLLGQAASPRPPEGKLHVTKSWTQLALGQETAKSVGHFRPDSMPYII